MSEDLPNYEWRSIGESVRGASHVRSNLPNQDAIFLEPLSPSSGPPLILAISDGHGSSRYFRSDVGAKIAVRIARSKMQQLLDGQGSSPNLVEIERIVTGRLPQSLVYEWLEAVDQHWRDTPLTIQEQELEKKDPVAWAELEKSPYLAYGATILTVLVADTFILYLQLGDGDILCVDALGRTTRPLPPDERLMANETTSLCSPGAWKEMRIRLAPFLDNPPVMILVTSDGYANSFRSEEGFLRIGQDYLEMVSSKGLAKVREALKGILGEASERGSGDDITLGLIKRSEEGDFDVVRKQIFGLNQNIERTIQLINDESNTRLSLETDTTAALATKADESALLNLSARIVTAYAEIQAALASKAEQDKLQQLADREARAREQINIELTNDLATRTANEATARAVLRTELVDKLAAETAARGDLQAKVMGELAEKASRDELQQLLETETKARQSLLERLNKLNSQVENLHSQQQADHGQITRLQLGLVVVSLVAIASALMAIILFLQR